MLNVDQQAGERIGEKQSTYPGKTGAAAKPTYISFV